MNPTKSIYKEEIAGSKYPAEYKLVPNEEIEKEIIEDIGEPAGNMFLKIFNEYANQNTKKTIFENSSFYRMYYQYAQIKDNPHIGITLKSGINIGVPGIGLLPTYKELCINLGGYIDIQIRPSVLCKIFNRQPIPLNIIKKITRNHKNSVYFIGDKKEWLFQKEKEPDCKQDISELQSKIKGDLEQRSCEIASISKNFPSNKYILNK